MSLCAYTLYIVDLLIEWSNKLKIAVVTDSNAGITKEEASKYGIHVVPMPFMIDGEEFFEDINLTHEDFYKKLEEGADVVTSQPSPEAVMNIWDELLKEYDQIVYIPMSSGLSGAYQTSKMLAEDYEDKVFPVNNQRISGTLFHSCIDAVELAKRGKTGSEIARILENDKFNSSIYIMIGTLDYLKKGGRLTPAVAAIGNILRIKPVLQIQGEKLDAFALARTFNNGKSTIINAVKKDAHSRYDCGDTYENLYITVVYSQSIEEAEEFKKEVEAEFPGATVEIATLSLSVACHIGPSSLALTVAKYMDYERV